jgi:hypothetical protein
MTHPVTAIDHILLIGQVLGATAAQFVALGFTLSERGIHPPAKGSENHTIMLQTDYIELLGLTGKTDLNRARFDAVARSGPGLHAICCRIGDASAAARSLAALGIATEMLNSFERPVPMADGTVGRAAFSTLNFRVEDVPVGLLFMCQHKTPETVWLPELMQHANTATGIASVTAISETPSEDATQFSRFMKDTTVTVAEGSAMVVTGPSSADVIFRSRAVLVADYPEEWVDATPRGGYAVMQVRVAQMKAAVACLERAEIARQATQTGVAVPPSLAGGVILEFSDPSAG